VRFKLGNPEPLRQLERFFGQPDSFVELAGEHSLPGGGGEHAHLRGRRGCSRYELFGTRQVGKGFVGRAAMPRGAREERGCLAGRLAVTRRD